MLQDPSMTGVHEAPETSSSAPSYSSSTMFLYSASRGPKMHLGVENTSGIILLPIVGKARAWTKSARATVESNT